MSALRLWILALLLLSSLCCGGGGSSSLAVGDGISGTGDFALSKVNLVSDSYGSGANNDFTVNTLAPIIKLNFENELPEHPEKYFKITMLDLNLQQSIVAEAGSEAFNALRIVKGSSGKDLYLNIPKKPTGDSTGYELRPGHHYYYTITPVDKKLFINGVQIPKLEGYLRVRNLTLTYLGDFEKGDSLTNDSDFLRGMDTLQPEFIIHSKFPLAGGNVIDGPLSGMSVTLGGLQLLKSNGFSVIEILGSSSTSTHFRLNENILSWGQSLNLSITPKSSKFITEQGDRAIVQDDLPSTLSLVTQSQQSL